jgi:NTE family protein
VERFSVFLLKETASGRGSTANKGKKGGQKAGGKKKVDAVFEGGGVKGIGFEYGIYEGEFFENWLEGLLKRKGKTTFGQIHTGNPEEKYKYRFQAVATDITDQKLLVLPGSLKDFGYEPDSFSIARAVRMSMSIPVFFEPVRLSDSSGRVHTIVDGGVLSNYPIWLLDQKDGDPSWPTLGFKLVEPDQRKLWDAYHNPINSPLSYLKALVGTMLDAHDSYHISVSGGDYDRTIGIPVAVTVDGTTTEIGTTDFDITPQESQALYDNGVKAGQKFLKGWNFNAWKKKYR